MQGAARFRCPEAIGLFVDLGGGRREAHRGGAGLTPRPRDRRTGGHVNVIETADAPSHTGPVPQAVEAGGWIYVSALFGADPKTHEIPADARGEAEQVF